MGSTSDHDSYRMDLDCPLEPSDTSNGAPLEGSSGVQMQEFSRVACYRQIHEHLWPASRKPKIRSTDSPSSSLPPLEVNMNPYDVQPPHVEAGYGG